jgi:uncharacterized RDD family membrane protein YckC
MATKKQRQVFAGVWVSYFTVCMLAFIWPLATVGNSIEPRILGVPFIITWFLLWVLIIFAGSVGMYVWDLRLSPRGGRRG